MSPGTSPVRRVVLGVVALALLVLAAWCVIRGVSVRTTTGDLLTEPVAQTRLAGGWLLAAATAFTTAVLLGLAVVRPLPEPGEPRPARSS